MNIREINRNDCENLSALSILVWLSTYAKDGIREKISRFVLNEFKPEKFAEIVDSPSKKAYLASHKQHIVGIVVVDMESKYEGSHEFGYEIETLYVHPNFQGKGVGKLLLTSIENFLGRISWLSTWVHNTSAIKFYEKNGYKIVGKAQFNLLSETHINHVLSDR